jgi:signal transduction histidine kinase/ActR/RegA family two-component response regulator
VPVGIAFLDRELRYTKVNEMFAGVHQQSPEWFVGKLVHEVVPEVAAVVAPRLESVMATGRSLMNVPSTPRPYDALGRGRHWLSSYFPVRDQSGGMIGVGVVLSDVTERFNIEDQFYHAQKMEAVGRLASGVAHDFNNLLTIIGSYTDILLMQDELNEEARSGLLEVRSATDRATVLARQLLTFTRQNVVAPRTLDVRPRLQALGEMLARVLPAEVNLSVDASDDVGPVEIDQGHLDQILMNLAVNAIDAMPDGGRLTITAEPFEADDAFVSRVPGSARRRYVVLGVSDTGDGIDRVTLMRIFEPYFTTKSVDKGTGLGLSTVYALVTQYHGFLQVSSEIGRGTTMKVHLPVADTTEGAPPAREPVDESPSAPKRRAATSLLVVEDDESVRETLQRVLVARGYQVRGAVSRAEAEHLIANIREPVHLVLSERGPDDRSTHSFTERVRSTHPETNFLLIAGSAAAGAVGELPVRSLVLRKPFTVDELMVAVREALTAAPPLPPS